MRLVSIKAAVDDLANSLNDGPKKFYTDLKKRCPSFILTMPNGEEMHITDIIKLLRDELSHRGRDSEQQRRLMELTGSTDPVDFLAWPVMTYTNGMEIKHFTYCEQIKSYDIPLNNTMIDVITSECISMLMMYRHLLENDEDTENDCINRNWWRPYLYDGKLPSLYDRNLR